jgi:hypothetical protein
VLFPDQLRFVTSSFTLSYTAHDFAADFGFVSYPCI